MPGKSKRIPVEWKDQYRVKVGIIDEGHRKFVGILQQLDHYLDEGTCREKVSELFFSLVNYAEHYLIQEEIYFKNYQYTQFSHHKESHRHFIGMVDKFREDYEKGSSTICEEMRDFLYGWFRNHILQYDKEAVDFLVQKGLNK